MDRQKGILGKGTVREVQRNGKANVETASGSGSDGKGKWESHDSGKTENELLEDKFGPSWTDRKKESDLSAQLFIERTLHPNDTLTTKEKEQFLGNAKKDKDLSESDLLALTNKVEGIIEGIERIPIAFRLTTIVHDAKAKNIIESYNRNIRSYSNEKRAGFFRAALGDLNEMHEKVNRAQRKARQWTT